MEKTQIFSMGKDDFYPRLTAAVQSAQKKGLTYNFTFRIDAENHESGVMKLVVQANAFGLHEDYASVHITYYEDGGNTCCTAKTNVPLTSKPYQGKINKMVEDLFQKICYM